MCLINAQAVAQEYEKIRTFDASGKIQSVTERFFIPPTTVLIEGVPTPLNDGYYRETYTSFNYVNTWENHRNVHGSFNALPVINANIPITQVTFGSVDARNGIANNIRDWGGSLSDSWGHLQVPLMKFNSYINHCDGSYSFKVGAEQATARFEESSRKAKAAAVSFDFAKAHDHLEQAQFDVSQAFGYYSVPLNSADVIHEIRSQFNGGFLGGGLSGGPPCTDYTRDDIAKGWKTSNKRLNNTAMKFKSSNENIKKIP